MDLGRIRERFPATILAPAVSDADTPSSNEPYATGESYQKYETALVTMRRAGGFRAENRLLQVYDNLQPDYKLYVRFDDLASRIYGAVL